MLNVGVGVFWQVLSAYNANFDIMDETGSTPMHYAAMSGRELCIRFLAQRGTSNSAVTERPRDASCLSVATVLYVERNLLLSVTLALGSQIKKWELLISPDVPCRTNFYKGR